MLRKHILDRGLELPARSPGEKDIEAIATVSVTSEATDCPIDNVFDDRRGPGGSRWMADKPGEQVVSLAFDTPQTIRTISLEIEEQDVSRTQELQLALSRDGGQTYHEVVRQEYTFAPPGTTFERELWTVNAEGITHLRLVITPDKSRRPCRGTLTSLVLQ